MKEKKKSKGEYEFGAYVGCAALSWISFQIVTTLGFLIVVEKIINWEQFIFIFVPLITIFLGLGITFTYQFVKLGRKLKEIRDERGNKKEGRA